jgi:hypothetical protein
MESTNFYIIAVGGGRELGVTADAVTIIDGAAVFTTSGAVIAAFQPGWSWLAEASQAGVPVAVRPARVTVPQPVEPSAEDREELRRMRLVELVAEVAECPDGVTASMLYRMRRDVTFERAWQILSDAVDQCVLRRVDALTPTGQISKRNTRFYAVPTDAS